MFPVIPRRRREFGVDQRMVENKRNLEWLTNGTTSRYKKAAKKYTNKTRHVQKISDPPPQKSSHPTQNHDPFLSINRQTASLKCAKNQGILAPNPVILPIGCAGRDLRDMRTHTGENAISQTHRYKHCFLPQGTPCRFRAHTLRSCLVAPRSNNLSRLLLLPYTPLFIVEPCSSTLSQVFSLPWIHRTA